MNDISFDMKNFFFYS